MSATVKQKSADCKAQLRSGGVEQHSLPLISPALHERLKQGLRPVLKIIKSLMRLKDKASKGRVQLLALGREALQSLRGN